MLLTKCGIVWYGKKNPPKRTSDNLTSWTKPTSNSVHRRLLSYIEVGTEVLVSKKKSISQTAFKRIVSSNEWYVKWTRSNFSVDLSFLLKMSDVEAMKFGTQVLHSKRWAGNASNDVWNLVVIQKITVDRPTSRWTIRMSVWGFC